MLSGEIALRITIIIIIIISEQPIRFANIFHLFGLQLNKVHIACIVPK